MLYQMENQHGGDVYGGGITLDFSANTNPLGTPPGVLEAVSTQTVSPSSASCFFSTPETVAST